MNNSYEKNDVDTPISYFKEKVKKFIKDRNWTKYHSPKNLIQALSIEVAELSELFLFKELEIVEILEDEALLSNIEDEVADIFIYLLSFINTLDIDLTQTFIRKMEKNNKKYPMKEFNKGIYYKK